MSVGAVDALSTARPGDPEIVRGEGGYCVGARGERYVDLICGYGPVILGHGDPGVAEAVAEQMRNGLLLPGVAPQLAELTALLDALLGRSRMYHFCKTGSEAVASAVRLARAYTGRPLIVRCGFHGWHDPFVAPDLAWHDYDPPRGARGEVPGLAEGSSANIITWDEARLDTLQALVTAHRARIAAVLIDPVQIAVPSAETFAELRALTRSAGILLVLDELKTGFRVARFGVDALYQVGADLIVYGKAIANGMPLALVAGPREIMTLARQCRLKGTFNLELASIVAACTTLRTLRRLDAPSLLARLGEMLIAGLNEVFHEAGVERQLQAVPYRWPCMPYIRFMGDAVDWKGRFCERLRERGVFMLAGHMNFVCCAHSARDIEFVIEAARDLVAEGAVPP